MPTVTLNPLLDNSAWGSCHRITRGRQRVAIAGLVDRKSAERGLSSCSVDRNCVCSAQGSPRSGVVLDRSVTFWAVPVTVFPTAS